jgi:cholesterol oxidase
VPIRPMSSSAGPLRPRYSVVIVGSGYGGSVLAARLSEHHDAAPDGICLLERGLELHPGDYPDRITNAPRHIQASSRRWSLGSKSAMFDFRFGTDVNVLVGCGLGGGSLINAGVSLRAPDTAFASGWPAVIDGEELDVHYKRAEATLMPDVYPNIHELDKFRALDRSAIALGTRAVQARINVTFSGGSTPAGSAGVIQPPCTACGDCVSGCNVGSKNTLLMNYLPIALRNGVEMFTRTGVRAVQRGKGRLSGKWLVYVNQPWDGSPRSPSAVVVADKVILAAGTLGSTEILMRSQNLGVRLSRRLGARFSANGDVLGFAFDGRSPVNAIAGGVRSVRHSAVGPCITGMAHVDWTKDGVTKRILLEEGAVPAAIAPLLPLAFAVGAIRRRRWGFLKALAGPYRGALSRTLPYLMIYPDDDGGCMALRADRLEVDWPNQSGRPAYQAHRALLAKAAKGLGAKAYHQPGVSGTASPLTTVHPLGGCVMAEDAEHGVVDPDCRVFSSQTGTAVHEGLYVCDGSVIPVALGVNPLLTISALAERTAYRINGSALPKSPSMSARPGP